MSKRAEDLADKIYPFRYDSHGDVIDFKNTIILRGVCIEIYKQAEKDILSIIQSRLEELYGDAQPRPILRAELQELMIKIMEEEK